MTSKNFRSLIQFFHLIKFDFCALFIFLAFSLQNTIVSQLMEDKFCLNELKLNDSFCDTFALNPNARKTHSILQAASNFKRWQSIMTNTPTLVVVVFLGYWLGHYPRYFKQTVVLPFVGLIKDKSRSKSVQSYSEVVIKNGLSVVTTVLFVAGENAGAGILALPHTLNNAGWFGVPLMLMICLDSAIAACLIGKCWLILEERWPVYRSNCRDPYPEIGKMAYGPRMKSMVTLALQVTLIGTSAVLLLVCVQLMSDLIDRHDTLSYGVWMLIVALVICPFMWLGTPVEFWPAAVLALGTSTLAIALAMFDITRDLISASNKLPVGSPVTLSTVSLAFGSLMFTYGGTGPFPTYQNDMADKSKWPQAVIFGFIILLILTAPIAILGYLAYGSSVSTNIIHSIPNGINRDVITILMAGHLFFGFLLMINPAVQEIENKLKVPRSFNWKRVAVRVIMLFSILFICETIPRFGKILDLIGGSTMNCLAYIFPPLFYLKLCSMKNPSWPERRITTIEKLYFYKIIFIGVIGGICSTISAAVAIVGPDAFVLPCYIDLNCTD